MKLTYDRESDTLLLVLTKNLIEETEEIRPGFWPTSTKAARWLVSKFLTPPAKLIR